MKNKLKLRIVSYVKSNYKKVAPEDFTLGDINYTHRCHLNAVQKVKEGKSQKVYSCVAIDKEDPKIVIVHFINQNQDGKFVDNTWGWMHQHYDYYLIKEISFDEQNKIWEQLTDTKKMLFQLNSNWIEKWVLEYNII